MFKIKLLSFVLLFSLLGCKEPKPVANASKANDLLFQRKLEKLGLPTAEQKRLVQLPRITHVDHCTFVSEYFPAKHWPVIEVKRTVAHEGDTTHITAASIKVLDAKGCRLAVKDSKSRSLYMRMGTIKRARLHLAFSFACSVYRGSSFIELRSDSRIIADYFKCGNKSQSFHKPEKRAAAPKIPSGK